MMPQTQIFTDEDIKKIINESHIPSDEKERLVKTIPGMDQRIRALLSLNLMLQESIDKDSKIASVREKYKDDPSKLKEEMDKIDLDEKKQLEEKLKRKKIEELRSQLKE